MDYINYMVIKFIKELDKIIKWPKKPSYKKAVIEFLATKFEFKKNILKNKSIES